jgi:putative nucleotidyltransferase with HDIG domain
VETLSGQPLPGRPSSPAASGSELVLESRARSLQQLADREFRLSAGVAVSFLAAAAALAWLPASRPFSAGIFVLLAALYTLACQVEFEIGTGRAVPTQLVFVPMLFLLPPWAAALCVASGLVAAGVVECVRTGASASRVLVMLGSSWHSIGPAVVLGVLAAGEPPEWGNWWIYVLALAAQFGIDLASSVLPEWLGLGVRPRQVVRYLGWVYIVDAALAPAALFAAFAADHNGAWPVLLCLPLIGLFGFFARERRARIEQEVELSTAYRGTALLLGDVIEGEDAYTGAHSREVVELVVRVAAELGLSPRDRRLAEFAALLHDVGKVRIPTEIIQKPGKLTPEEWAIMKTHTLEGEQMLGRIGGFLAEVGTIVRSCHERFDGRGYPDGLAGDDIPLVARIVCCCDAFNAMTTDRPYRRALPLDEAIAEVRRSTPGHFDPQVVDALLQTVEPEQRLKLAA